MDRACGAVLASAAGDALGAGYEFGTTHLGDGSPQMIGGGLGGFAPGEWTDDTTMAWCILQVAATGSDLRTNEARSAIARNFRQWYDTRPPDIGIQTRSVLSAAGPEPSGESLTSAAAAHFARTGRAGGNGSLMRTAPVALAHLDDAEALAAAARAISDLTHADAVAGDACVLWCLAIRHAILQAEFDVRSGLPLLPEHSRPQWQGWIDEAEQQSPATFRPNGYVVAAFQAAWSAICQTAVPSDGPACAHLVDALQTAIRIGDDTDTVAAIAGALLGARWGASGVPARWRRLLHGYPGLRGEELVGLAHLAARSGHPGPYGWPQCDRIDYSRFQGTPVLAQHPDDDGVWLGDATALTTPPSEVSAVVSLCLLGTADVASEIEHIPFRLIDEADPGKNPNLDFVLTDAADTIATLRAEGRSVLVHCVAAHSRTPAVALAYALRHGTPYDEADEALGRVLPGARMNPGFREAIRQLAKRT